MPRVAGVGVAVRVTGGVEGGERDLVHPEVVRVLVEGALVAVGDQHLRLLAPDHGDQPADGLLERRVGEVVGAGVGLGVGHGHG